jgi:squalene-hopene/tetraprenyl-beta-curcumene cyclase
MLFRCSRHFVLPMFFILTAALTGPSTNAAEPAPQGLGWKSDLSLKNEVQHAIERGLRWLSNRQDPKGFWSQPDHPALTALVLTAFMGEPSGHFKSDPPSYIKNGYAYLVECARPDGGIYVKDLPNYNTSLAMMALVAAYDRSFDPLLRKARNFTAGQQMISGEKGNTANPSDGGIGYGSQKERSDLSNTVFALEALYYTRFLATDKQADGDELKELDWKAVITFIQRCQNLPGYNDQAWASDDPQNKGGFVYTPGESKAGEMQLPSGKTALRSYASMSYAGLLSYIYADLDRDDPRVKAVLDWLKRNYTLEENPGMEQQGLFYYYHTMAKALSICGVQNMALEDGKEVNWRREVALRLINLQKPDGSWVNENGRWWEKDPVLVTAYAAITLEIVYRGL